MHSEAALSESLSLLLRVAFSSSPSRFLFFSESFSLCCSSTPSGSLLRRGCPRRDFGSASQVIQSEQIMRSRHPIYAIRVMTSESWHPKPTIRVTHSRPFHPSHAIRVTPSESHHPCHAIRVVRVTPLPASQVVLLVKQMEFSAGRGAAGKVSIVSVALQVRASRSASLFPTRKYRRRPQIHVVSL